MIPDLEADQNTQSHDGETAAHLIMLFSWHFWLD